MLSAPARQASSLAETEHRPWSLPSSSWVMGQTWDDLLFAHWRVDADVVRPHVPDGLSIDERDGSAWVGVTPFVVTGLRARGLFPLPYVSSFRELNVRTYVTFEDKPGIWFFSLDASSEVAVRAARRTAAVRVRAQRGEGVQRVVSRSRRATVGGSRVPRALPDGAVLLLCRARRPAVPCGHPPPAVAARAGGGIDRPEHDATGRDHARGRAGAALLATTGRRHLAARRGGTARLSRLRRGVLFH